MSKRPASPNDLLRIVTVSDPTWRPGKDEIVFSRKHIGEKLKAMTHIWSVDLNGQTKQWTSGDSRNWSARWSPDGQALAFLSSRAKPGTQIFLLGADGGEARQLTNLPEGSFDGYKWSPDGKWIAFSFRENHADFTEAGAKKREETGESTPPRITESIWYRLDGDGFFMEQRHKIYVVEVATCVTRQIYEGCPVARYSFDWAPTSDRIVLTRSIADEPWIDPVNDHLFIVDLNGKAEMVPGLPKGEKLCVRWSPNGEWLAWFGNLNPEDHRGVSNEHLFLCRPDGTDFFDSTPDADINFNTYTLSDTAESPPVFLQWSSDSSRLHTMIGNRGEAHLAELHLESQEVRLLSEGRCVLTFGDVSENGSACCLHATPTQFPEVAVVDGVTGDRRRLTSFNEVLANELHLIEPEELNLVAADGYPVHGWMIKPLGFNPDAKHPAVLEVHGGPHAQYGWTYFHEFQILAGAGYLVVYTNPRGSKGYGTPHTAAIAGHWGGADWEDVKAAKDWMRVQIFIDPERVGIAGGSYGGFMVNWAVGHTDDFKAAITDRCVSNLISKSLNTDYPYHPGTHWKGAAYEEFEGIQELWRDSPIAYFHRVKTPMLIIHSEGDLRCHIEQGEQVFTALKERGVPARFVRYPSSTSHGMSRGGPVDLRMHRLNENLAWWARWL